MKSWAIVFAFGFIGLSVGGAQTPVRYEFAIPEFTEKLTLGVYDSSGQLVRKLAEEAVIADFTIGLNGLIGEWDGKNDAGDWASAGTYHLRGYALGDLGAEGEGYHFNDWVAELGAAAPLTRILAVAASPHGGLYLFAETSDARRLLGYYRSGQGLIWTRELSPPWGARLPIGPSFENGFLRRTLHSLLPARVAADDSAVAVVSEHRLSIFRSLTGGELSNHSLKHFSPAVAFSEGNWVLAEGNWVGNYSLPADVWIHQLAGSSFGLLASDQHGIVWKQEGNKWSRLRLADNARVTSLAWAAPKEFWAVGDEGQSARFVGQFSTDGEFLKNLQLPPDPFVPVTISSAPPNREVYVLRESPSGQQLLGVRPVTLADGTSGWELFLDKRILESANFGLAEGRPIAHTSQIPDTHFTLKMVDPMTQKTKQVRLEIVASAAGIQLRTSEGLILDTLMEASPGDRVAIQSGKKSGFLQLFVGRRGFVEEFYVRGLNQVALLDVGEIEWP